MDDGILKLIADGYNELQPETVETSTEDTYDPAEDELPLYLRLAKGFEQHAINDVGE